MKQFRSWILILLLAGFCLLAQAEEHEHFIHYQGYDADAHYGRCMLCGEEFEEEHIYTICKPLMIKEGEEYSATGIHQSFCEVCMVPKGVEMCTDTDGEAPFECRECLASFGRFVFNAEEEHDVLSYRQLWLEMDGVYEASGSHVKYCDICFSMTEETCVDFSESPQKIDGNVHGQKCIFCQEHYDIQEHSGAYQINGAEEHFVVCDSCGFEYLREAHDYVWYANADDPENKTHKGYCAECNYEPGVLLHEDADEDNRCDLCLWDLPFCMECGTDIRNIEAITYEERVINGETVHACLCEHGNVYLTHEADENAFCISAGNDGHVMKCMANDIAQCTVQGVLVPHADSVEYRKDYSGNGSMHSVCCEECVVVEGVTPMEAHQAGDEYGCVWNEEYSSSDVHARVCVYCHDHIPGTEQVHAFVGYMSFDGHTHAPMCTACGYADETAKEAHTPVYSDKNGWWICEIDCGVCGALLDYVGHVAKEKGEDLGEGWHFFTCANCGFSGEGYHEGEYTYASIGDAEYHQSTVDCFICGAKYTEESLHFKNLCSDNTCPCGQEHAVIAPENAGHEFLVWIDTGDQHITFCNICGAEGEGAEHTYSCTQGICTECGYETNRGTAVHECGGNRDLCGGSRLLENMRIDLDALFRAFQAAAF